ncbi:MFS transporter [Pseudohongiella nitratireducens]|uniref:MFS transporter n=1 Tax=Pseudohongiella nitratireducens TaxID=1768907 RepID=A0A916VL96_9GAMM|nr:DHA2 family efflux MFS transporter permease subunit [Pseudohongiella nitratireducens]GFZ84528.1 MFS transporter [Pseudohongiella nitratireducens]
MDATDQKPPPIPMRAWGISAVTGAGAFIAMLDSTVVNLAIESIRSDFSSTLPIVQWVATDYLCALAVSLPAAAWLGVRYGYGRVWTISLAVFVAASILCAMAPNPSTLIIARILQGLAGGLMVPAGQAVIGSTVEKRQLGRIFGLLGFVIALGPAVGPAVGGFFLETASWRWVFWINVPIGLAALMAAPGLVPRGRTDNARELDHRGLLLLGIGLPLLLYGALGAGVGELALTTVLSVAAGLILTCLFIISALRVANPLIDIRLLARPAFSSATLTAGLSGMNMYGGMLLLPLYLQLIANQGPLQAGLWFLVMGMGSAIALPFAGMMTDRFGAGIVSLGGAALLLVSTVPFLLPGDPAYIALTAILLVRGIGLGLVQMPAMTAAYSAVSKKEMGDATTLVNIVQRVGGAIGAMVVVIVLQQLGGSADPFAQFLAFAFIAGVSALTLVTALVMFLHKKAEAS